MYTIKRRAYRQDACYYTDFTIHNKTAHLPPDATLFPSGEQHQVNNHQQQ
ncbi:unnamed protein product [Paramecium pentaurelia]|uniref:Uncharacterized protein n=1 Tax=Paramecium pentaurelia TaxID=43138 RepID=A0A8S1XG22_9CILI|nr:unnamed protein product [Paramecium pentaurelia]